MWVELSIVFKRRTTRWHIFLTKNYYWSLFWCLQHSFIDENTMCLTSISTKCRRMRAKLSLVFQRECWTLDNSLVKILMNFGRIDKMYDLQFFQVEAITSMKIRSIIQPLGRLEFQCWFFLLYNRWKKVWQQFCHLFDQWISKIWLILVEK